MSDTNMQVGIGLEVETRNTDDIRKLEAKLKSLDSLAKSIASSIRTAATVNPTSPTGKAGRATDPAKAIRAEQAAQARAFRAQFAFNTRMHRQAEAEARRQVQGDERAFRMRMAWNDRLWRQREAEQRQAERAETAAQSRRERDTAKTARRQIAFNSRMIAQRSREEAAASRDQERAALNRARADAYRTRQAEIAERRADRESADNRRDVIRYGRSTVQHGHDAYSRIARPIATGAAVAAGAGALAARNGISARMETDTAETNLKIFSEQTSEQIRSARRGWLDAEAIKHGQSIAAGLNAYGEVLKSGIKSPVENTKMLMGAVSALELDLAQTTKLAGLIDRNYGSASSPAKLKSAMNAIAIAAREDPTQAPEIVEGVKRGFGVLSMGNMTPEELAAFVSGGQSVGIQPGKAGTFIATLGKQLSSGANPFLDPKNRKELNFAARNLGFGNAKAMAEAFKTDSTGTILKALEGLKALDPTKRTAVASALSGNQWNDEDLQIVNGLDGLKNTLKAIKDPAKANFLDEAARKRQESWLGQWNSTRAIINRFWESFGSGFDEILTAFNKTFLDASSRFDFDRVTEIVRQGLAGVKDALGIMKWKEFFSGAFGGNLASAGAQVREFARGFTDGVLSVVRTIRSVFTAFTGTTASTETLAKITGQIVALAAACVVAAPVVGVLAGLVSIIQALVAVGGGLAALKGLSAGGIAGAAVWTTVGGVIGAAFLATVANKLGILQAPDTSKGFGRALLEFLDPGLASRVYGDGIKPETKGWVDPPAKKSIDSLRESLDENAKVLKQSFTAPESMGGLVRKASISTTGTASALRSDISGIGAAYRSVPLSGSVGAAPLSESAPGSPINGGSGLSRRGILGGGGSVGSGDSGGNVPAGVGAGLGARGGSRSWRNNNPGNIEYGPFAKSMGATGSDGRFAIFPDYKSGRNAQEKLLFESKGYRDLTLGQAIRRWAPASENNVPAYVAALGGDSSKKMHEYTPAERSKLQDLMQKHEGWRVGIPGVNAGGSSSIVGGGVVSQAAENAKSLVGMGSSGAAQALGKRMSPGQWCADFVNGALSSANIKGTNSSIANSFLGRGKQVIDTVKSGDVLVEHRGRGQGVPGGHVGIATGQTRMGPRGLQFEQISGNHGGRVAQSWVDATRVAARRAAETSQAAADAAKSSTSIGDNFTSSGWKPAQVGGELGKSAPLGTETPIRSGNTQPHGGVRPQGAGGSGGGGAPVAIHVNGGNNDPEAIANAVQRRLQQENNRRTNDVDAYSM